MRRLLLLTLVLMLPALTGCPATGGVPMHFNDRGENCQGNIPPFIQNVELNSFLIAGQEASGYRMSVHFEWFDPGDPSANNPPSNIEGGDLTIEFGGYTSEDVPMTESLLVATCESLLVGDGEEAVDPCVLAGHGLGGGCPSGQDIDGCVGGALTTIWVGTSGPLVNNEVVDVEFRLRDRCMGTSNEKSASYQIGSGLAIEGGGGDEGA